MTIRIVDLDDTTLEAAGALVAREHITARQAHPSLPGEYGAKARCTATLARICDRGGVGAVAVEGGTALAVMAAGVRGTYAIAPAAAFAVDPGVDDPTTVLARLYASVAERLLAAGAYRHLVHHLAVPRLSEAMANLAFGRDHVYATQAAAPRPAPGTGVRVRLGEDGDLDTIGRLAEEEIRYRSAPPVYGPPDTRSLADIVERHRELRQRGAIHFLADIDGADVGLLTLEPSSPAPRLCADGEPYIGPTATTQAMRGRGVGATLVAAALDHAYRAGHRWVNVDFEPSNPLSRPFWLGAGFRPVGYAALRCIHTAEPA